MQNSFFGLVLCLRPFNLNQPVYINARFLTQQITGVQQFAFEICRYLQHSTLEFILLAPQGVKIPDALSHLTYQYVGKNKGYIWEQIELPGYLKQKGSPLLLNFCNTAPLFYQNQWVTIHDLAFMHHPEWFSKSFAKVYRYLIPRIAKRSRKVFTVSETIKEQLNTVLDVPLDKIALLYNGIPQELLQYRSHTPKKRNIILTVSSINPRKNLSFLVEAFEKSGLTGYELIIVGAGNTVFAGQKTTDAHNISFTGYLSNHELYELYHQAKLFVSLSLDEGFGIPVLESLYCGCPVLLSDIDVYRECFAEVAQYTSPSDSQIAAQALRTAAEHPPVAQGIQTLLAKYNYEASAHALIKMLRETGEKM